MRMIARPSPRLRFGLIAILCVAAGLSAGCREDSGQRAFKVQMKPTRAPDFTLTAMDGSIVHLADLLGKKPVVLDFFATWCAACMAQIPETKAFYGKYAGEELAFFAISVDEERAALERWLGRAGVPYPVLHDPQRLAARPYAPSGVIGLPLTVGIDREGNVIYLDSGLPRDIPGFIERLKNPPAPEPAAAPIPAKPLPNSTPETSPTAPPGEVSAKPN